MFLQVKKVAVLFILAVSCSSFQVHHHIPRSLLQYKFLERAKSSTKIKNFNQFENEKHEIDLSLASTAAAVFMWGSLVAPAISLAVSGGGLDFADLDITGQDFSNNNYKKKDFTQVIAKGTNFANSNLQGCRFYKAFLVNADFSGADVRGASFESTSMDNVVLKDANAAGAYFSASVVDVASIENGDFTDAQFPPKVLVRLCDRPDAKGTNSMSGADTRESLMCP